MNTQAHECGTSSYQARQHLTATITQHMLPLKAPISFLMRPNFKL